MDEMYYRRFKDAHICRNTWENKCWWRVYQLLQKVLDEKQVQELLTYRSKLINIILKYPEIGDFRENKRVHLEQSMRATYLRNNLDIRNEWSYHYPRVFKPGAKPKFVNWEEEKLLRDDSANAKFEYYVIPRLNASHFYVNATPNFCSNCREVSFE